MKKEVMKKFFSHFKGGKELIKRLDKDDSFQGIRLTDKMDFISFASQEFSTLPTKVYKGNLRKLIPLKDACFVLGAADQSDQSDQPDQFDLPIFQPLGDVSTEIWHISMP